MKIKTLPLLIIIVLSFTLCPWSAEAGLILSAGQSFEFEFSSIDPRTPFDPRTPLLDDSFTYAIVEFGADVLDVGESLVFSVFEDDSNQAAIRSDTSTGGPIAGVMYLTTVGTAPWSDRQGIFRVEVVSGTIELDAFTATTVVGGQYYTQTYVVPEPSSIALLLLGAGALILRKNNSNNRLHSIAGSARSE